MYRVIPAPSIWNEPKVSPCAIMSNVMGSSSDTSYMSMDRPVSSSIILRHLSRTVRFLSPRKSHLSRPTCSSGFIANCVDGTSSSLVLEGRWSGARVTSGSSDMTTPAA